MTMLKTSMILGLLWLLAAHAALIIHRAMRFTPADQVQREWLRAMLANHTGVQIHDLRRERGLWHVRTNTGWMTTGDLLRCYKPEV